MHVLYQTVVLFYIDNGISQKRFTLLAGTTVHKHTKRRLSARVYPGLISPLIEAVYPGWPWWGLTGFEHLFPLLVGKAIADRLLELVIAQSGASTDDDPAIRDIVSYQEQVQRQGIRGTARDKADRSRLINRHHSQLGIR